MVKQKLNPGFWPQSSSLSHQTTNKANYPALSPVQILLMQKGLKQPLSKHAIIGKHHTMQCGMCLSGDARGTCVAGEAGIISASRRLVCHL